MELNFRKAELEDVKLYFDWVNDQEVREQSFDNHLIDFDSHIKWFKSKLVDNSCFMLIFQNNIMNPIGQVRIENTIQSGAIISISISKEHRGNGYAKDMIKISSDYFFKNTNQIIINAFIKESNVSSKYAFEKAGYIFNSILVYKNYNSYHYQLCL